MERRLSGSVAVAGLLAALGIFLLGREAPSDDVGVAAADLEAAIRENAAGAQARADTLAQLPRLGWAVATDENTMRDLTTEELAFRPHPGEHIEITQMRKGGGEPRRLLRLPAESDLALPVLPGTQVVVRAGKLHVVTVVSVEPRQRAEELVGILAVSKQIDTSAIEQRLAARGISAELRTIQGSLTLAGTAPASPETKVALTGPAAEGAVLVAANIGKARWPRIVSPLILLISLVAAAVLWRRGTVEARPAPSPSGARPAHAQAPPAPAAVLRSPSRPRPSDDTDPSAARRQPNEGAHAACRPIDGAHAHRRPDRGRGVGVQSVAGDARGGQSARRRGRGARRRSGSRPCRAGSRSRWCDPARCRCRRARPAALRRVTCRPRRDPRAEEYRSLFSEFVNLRRTTGESIEGLDVAHFVETLREKRAQLMKELRVKDVRFKLAFQNGKAAIRYLTVT